MRVPYERATDPAQVADVVFRLAPRTVIFDIEPLVAYWRTGVDELDRGLAEVRDRFSDIEALVFATNSRRTPTTTPPGSVYIALAGKPLRTASYRDFPRPGVLIGDQIATDGLLAWRLGYTFVQYQPAIAVPVRPRLMGHLGHLVRPLIFMR